MSCLFKGCLLHPAGAATPTRLRNSGAELAVTHFQWTPSLAVIGHEKEGACNT